MKKTAIVYHTMTGHSRKIAAAVAGALGVPAQNVKDEPQLEGVELLFVVGGIYGGNSLEPMLNFLKGLPTGAVCQAALITSCVSGQTKQAAVREALIGQGIPVVEEEYICRGNFLVMGMGHPNKDEIEGAAAFAKRLAGHS